MNRLYRISKVYFFRLEGVNLLRPFTSPRCGAWVLALISTAVFFVRSLVVADGNCQGTNNLLYVLSIVSLGVSSAVQSTYKRKRTLELFRKKYKAQFDHLSDCRCFMLKRVAKQPQSGFATLAFEIDALTGIARTYGVIGSTGPREWLRFIYDPDSKARINALALALLSMLAALLFKTDANVDSLFGASGNLDVRNFIYTIAFLLSGIFIVLFALRYLVVEMSPGMSLFLLIIGGSKRGNPQTLRYLVADLLRYYRP